MNPTLLLRGACLWAWPWVWAWVWVCVGGFNLAPKYHSIFNGSEDSKFGFSVALWSDVNDVRRVVVGAPRGKEDLPGGRVLGNVFYCATSNTCTKDSRLPVLNVTDNTLGAMGEGNEFTMKGQGIGTGQSLAALDTLRSNLSVCAPRYSYMDSGTIEKRGACFVLPVPDAEPQTILKTGSIPRTKKTILSNAMLGFSVSFDEESNSLIRGGPSSDSGAGLVERQHLESRFPKHSPKRSGSEYNDQLEGWAMAVGKFDGVSTFIAASAVNYGDYNGQVTFYTLDQVQPTTHPNSPLVGSGYVEKFGYSLTSGDLDWDGVDDLVVGSPLAPGRTKNDPDVGRVTVFYAPLIEDASRIRPNTELLGVDRSGQFGFATAILGDLNLDGFNDLAVSSPFGGKEGAGVVYIYNGGANGLTKEAQQAIHASDFAYGLRGFGFSIDGGIDMDRNSYPDMVVGATESNQAVLIRSSPVVSLQGRIFFEPNPITVEDRDVCEVAVPGYKYFKAICFYLSYDITYTSTNDLGDLDMQFYMVLGGKEDTSQFGFRSNNDHQYTLPLRSVKYNTTSGTKRVAVYVKRDRSNIGMTLEAAMSVSLPAATPGGELTQDTPVSPILDLFSPTTFTANTIILCNNNVTCFSSPDVSITAVGHPVIIGENDLKVDVSLEVKDDPAYNVKVEVEYSHLVKYVRAGGEGLIPNCRHTSLISQIQTKLECMLKVVQEDAKVNFSLIFNYTSTQLLEEISGGRLKTLPLKLTTISDTGDDNDMSDNEVEIEVDVKPFSVLHTQRDALPETKSVVVNKTATAKEIKDAVTKPFPVNRLGPLLTHSFSLKNRGPSPILGGKLVFHLPLYQGRERATYYTELPTTVGPVTCNTSAIHLNPLFLMDPVEEEEYARRSTSPTTLHHTPTTPHYTPTTPYHNTNTSDHTITTPYHNLNTHDYTTDTPYHTTNTPYHPANTLLHTPETFEASPHRRPRRQVTPPDDTPTPSPPLIATDDPIYDILTTFDPEQPTTTSGRQFSSKGSLPVQCLRPECSVTCEVGLLEEGEEVKVSFSSYLVVSTISKITTIRSASVQTWMTAELNQNISKVVNPKINAKTYISIVRPREDGYLKIPLWILPVAVLVALLLILIIIGILCKAGFFKRNRPPKGDRMSMRAPPPTEEGYPGDSVEWLANPRDVDGGIDENE